MATEGLKQKQQRKPKYKVRALHPVPPVWPSRVPCTASSVSAECACGNSPMRARSQA